MGNKHIHPSCIQLNLQFHSDSDDRLRDRYGSNAAKAIQHCRVVAQLVPAVAKCVAIAMEQRLTHGGSASIIHETRTELSR